MSDGISTLGVVGACVAFERWATPDIPVPLDVLGLVPASFPLACFLGGGACVAESSSSLSECDPVGEQDRDSISDGSTCIMHMLLLLQFFGFGHLVWACRLLARWVGHPDMSQGDTCVRCCMHVVVWGCARHICRVVYMCV